MSNTILRYMLEANGDPGLGHRRQLLDYYYTEAGFGIAQSKSGGDYSATFVGSNLREDKIISYPGQNQPLEYFGPAYAWTVIIPEKVEQSAVNVRVTNVKTREEWNFSQSANNLRLALNGSQSACAIFAPSTDYRDGDQYKVEVTGIANPISYEVNMFWVDEPVPLESISMERNMASLTEGSTGSLFRVKYVPENASNKIVTWVSSNLDVAEPLREGTGICSIVAKKPGTAVITAISEDGGHTAEMTVLVKPKATGIKLNKTDLTIGVGESFILTGTVFPEEAEDWITNSGSQNDYDHDIISVDSYPPKDGIRITGEAIGETSVTIYAAHSKEAAAVCKIHVVESVDITDFYFEETEMELIKGDVVPLNLIIEPDNTTCKGIEWFTSKFDVADVEDGVVTAKKKGEAVITARAWDSSRTQAQCTVKVYEKYEKADAPQLEHATCNEITLVEMLGCEYSMDLENWQFSNVFTDLEPDHEYTFYARWEGWESAYFKAGDASEGAVFRTKAVDDCPHTDKEVRNMRQASCLENGYTGDTYCKDCGAKLSEGEAAEAVGHEYASKVTKKPTVSEEGVRTYTCIRCQDSYTKAIPKLQSSDGEAENINKAVVTLSKGTCNYTGKVQEPTVKMLKLGQQILNPDTDYTVNYRDNVNIGTASVIITGKGHYTGTITKKFSITAKKGSRFTAGAYKYQIKGASEVAFAGLKSSKTAKVAIPKTVKIGGKAFKVTSVDKNALKNTKVTSVSVGANVTTVGTSAFEGCTQLTKVTVGGKATKIGANAFKNCKKLGNITIKSAKLKSVGKNALKGIKAIAKIKVPAKKLSAYKKLFKNKGQGKKVKIVK